MNNQNYSSSVVDYSKGEWVYECVWKRERERERDRKKRRGHGEPVDLWFLKVSSVWFGFNYVVNKVIVTIRLVRFSLTSVNLR